MVRGIYTGASGMLAEMTNLDVIANNLANADKTAYKEDVAIFKNFPEMLIRRINDNGVGITPLGSYDVMPIIGKLGTGVSVNEVYTKFTQGPLYRTGNPFDIAIEGQGFFVIKTPLGIRYTRNGNFTINKDGYIVTHNGDYLLGEKGPIKVQRFNFRIEPDGKIVVNPKLLNKKVVSPYDNTWEKEEVIDRIKIVDFPEKRELKKCGDSYFRETTYSGKPFEAQNFKLHQGFIEKSNVNIVKEMVRMIEAHRSYEANQKSIISEDQSLAKCINEVGK
jgi:flagellar basal-body rod protein FlgG